MYAYHGSGNFPWRNQQRLLKSRLTGSLQGIHGHAHRVRQSSAAEQSQMLKISFLSIAAGLNASSYQSQEVVKQDIQEICRSAAEAFSSQDQVCLCVDPHFMTVINWLSYCLLLLSPWLTVLLLSTSSKPCKLCTTPAGSHTLTRRPRANAPPTCHVEALVICLQRDLLSLTKPVLFLSSADCHATQATETIRNFTIICTCLPAMAGFLQKCLTLF